MTKVPIIREDDGELLGFIESDSTGWSAQTIFGYVFARDTHRPAIEDAVRSQGLSLLQGVWQYFDKDDQRWYACVIKEAFENKVIVIRTNDMGYQNPDDYRLVTIVRPTETTLVKA